MRTILIMCGLLLVACSSERPAPAQLSAPLGEVQRGAPESGRARSGNLLAAPGESKPVPTALAEPEQRDVREPSAWKADLRWSGKQRVAHANSAKLDTVRALFEQAGVSWPPKDVLFRVFKQEAEFEVWAGDGESQLKRIATYGVCSASGELGPKRREGDLQVPEGFYKVGYYHPTSAYYLAAQVDYPNLSDKLRGGASPGGDILIHGRCASIGCIAMTDERIEEIYLVGWAAFMAGKPTHIHIFPGRKLDALLEDAKYLQHHAFWKELAPGLSAFEQTHRLPSISIDSDGRYVVATSP